MVPDRKQTIEFNHTKYHWFEFDTVDSTNSACLRAHKSGNTGNLWITAECQTRGRGRNRRHWVSESGNLYCSLLLVNPAESDSKIGQLSFVAVVALAETIENITAGKINAECKWPNDLLVNGSKISGILLESEQKSSGSCAVVIGFGVNCGSHPANCSYPTTDLASIGHRIEPRDLFEDLVATLDRWLQIWNGGRNFEEIRGKWLSKAAGIGKRINVQLPNQKLEGVFSGVDSDGQLILKFQDGNNRLISAGDVFFPNNVEELVQA